MTSFVNVCDIKSAEKRYACLKIVNKYDMRFISWMSWVTCGQEKEFQLLGKNKITDFICLINHGIFPPNMSHRCFTVALSRDGALNGF